MQQNNHQSSQQIVCQVIQNIMVPVFETINQRQYLANNTNKYCLHKSVEYNNQIYSQLYYQQQQSSKQQNMSEPLPLIWDNLFPTAAELEKQQQIQLRNNKIKDNYKTIKMKTQTRSNGNKSIDNKSEIPNLSQISSNVSGADLKKHKNTIQMEKYQKLNLPQPQEQQHIYKEMRKTYQQQQVKNAQKNNKLNKQRLQKGKKQSKKRDQRLGFDYQGNIVQLRQQNRNSLIEGGLNGQINLHLQKTKQTHGKVTPTEVDYVRKNNKKPNLRSDIQFTDIKTLLAESNIAKGIKIVEGGITLEEKHKTIPVKQLKQLLGRKKLSKQQFKRVRQSMGNVAQYDDLSKSVKSELQLEETSKQLELPGLKLIQQSKVSNSLTRRRSTITVSDPQLLQNMLHGPVNQANQQHHHNDNQEEGKNSIKCDEIDNYNLEYIKKGGKMEGGMKKKSRSMADLANLKLPKLGKQSTHTSNFGLSSAEFPKIRQKLKDSNEIIRQVRKRFQEKLRI